MKKKNASKQSKKKKLDPEKLGKKNYVWWNVGDLLRPFDLLDDDEIVVPPGL